MSVAGYKFTALTGGGAGALDAQDGAGLNDGDIAMVMLTSSGYIYWFELDADSGESESSPNIIAPDANAGNKRWKLRRQPSENSVPVGSVVAFIGGYFTNGSNAGFTNVIGNDAATVNALVNGDGWYVCNGAALNLGGSSIFNGASRYLPNLTDDRFIMGDTAAGTTGGSSSSSHTHTTGSHTLTISEMPSHSHTLSMYTNNNMIGGGSVDVMLSGYSTSTSSVGGGAAHNHGNTGAASATENRPQFLSCLYIMKAI